MQLAVLPTTFAIAFARWPRPTLRDLQLLLFIQVMIWLVIPIPGIMYFYRPFATNYLWGFTITLALIVPYRLALAQAGDGARRRWWLVPIMLALGWIAGMCNEHTGPAAMVAIAGLVYGAWRSRRLRAWMLAGMLGLYVGYPMLFFAPGQAVRYGGLATRDTPIKLLADRGLVGCFEILGDFLYESRLGILLFVAAVLRYVVTLYRRGDRIALPPRQVLEAGVLATAAAAIVVTLFVSPTTTDRVFYASGVLLVAAFAICAKQLFAERLVRRFVVGACIVVLGYHVVRFVQTSVEVQAESDDRIARLAAATPGSVAVVPTYDHPQRSRWQPGDDFVHYAWLRTYVGGELYDLARIDLDRPDPAPAPHLVATPPISHVPTYRQLQRSPDKRSTIRAVGLFDDLRHRPIVVADGDAFVDGRPYDESRGHFIRVRRDSMPRRLVATYTIGCNLIDRVELVEGGDDPLVPVDERYCRGPFTAIMCEPDRCWVAGWY